MFTALINMCYFLPLYVGIVFLGAGSYAFRDSDITLQKRQPLPSPLVDFQVSQPVLTPSGLSDQHGCISTTTLMEYEFANSYGAPFVGRSRRPLWSTF